MPRILDPHIDEAVMPDAPSDFAITVYVPSAHPLGMGAKDDDRYVGFGDVMALPEPEWARPQHAEDREQAYADAEARVAAAMWPQHLPKTTKQTTSKTVRVARDVRELLDLLEEAVFELALRPGGDHALRMLFAPVMARAGVSL